MKESVGIWLGEVLKQEIPEAVAALNFNLYDDGDDEWSVELVGTSRFDPEDPDWACDEVCDFGTREEPLSWHQESSWQDILEEMSQVLAEYMEDGEHADVLKRFEGVGVGFVDGDIEILFTK